MSNPASGKFKDVQARFGGLDVLELTRALVAVDSTNPGGSERVIAAFIGDLARSHGFSVQEIELAPARTNLIIDIDGGGRRVLGLCGHIDTKPVGDAAGEWRTPPFELTIQDGNGYGLGASDMKGGVAAMLVAAAQWAESAVSEGRLRLIFTADEEAGGVHGVEALTAARLVTADGIVVGEPSGVVHSWESIFTVSRGLCCFTVEIEGQQGHSGLSDRLPESATVSAAKALLAMHGLKPSFDPVLAFGSGPTVNAGVVLEGGVFFGVHPGSARLACDIRLVPGMDHETLDAEIRSALTAALPPEVRWRVTYANDSLGWMPPAAIAVGDPLVAAAQAATRDVFGSALPLAAYPGGTDASAFVLRGGVPTIASLGPGLLSVAHGPNEYVPIADLYTAVDLYTALARRYFP